MKTFFGFFFLVMTLTAAAQKKTVLFRSTLQAGLLEGERGTAFQWHTVNGIQYKTWSAGLGVGLDYYHTRSIPFFLNLRKALGKGESTPFVYASGGYHFPWLRESDKYLGTVEATGGLYLDAGVGYQLPVLKKSALFFSLGFSQKNFSEKTGSWAVIAIYPPPPLQTYISEYNLRRLSLQTGIRF